MALYFTISLIDQNRPVGTYQSYVLLTKAFHCLLSLKTRVLAALSIAVLAIRNHTETLCLLPLVDYEGQVIFTIVKFFYYHQYQSRDPE